MKRASAGIAIICALVWVLMLSQPAWSVDGEAIVTGKCTACHGTERIKEKKLSTGDWATLVDREIERGAQLNATERNAAIAYLSSTYGTASTPNAAPVADPVAQPAATTTTTPTEQAYTGVELWQFILAGGTMLGGGVLLRRRK